MDRVQDGKRAKRTDLPWSMLPFVKTVYARGNTYLYFKTGLTAPGRDRLLRLPAFTSPRFVEVYDAFRRARQGDGLFDQAAFEVAWCSDVRARLTYFIGGSIGAIKIGYSSAIDARLASLQTGSPIPLRVLATAPGGRDTERAYHERFASCRLQGEWFERHPLILAEIDYLIASVEQ